MRLMVEDVLDHLSASLSIDAIVTEFLSSLARTSLPVAPLPPSNFADGRPGEDRERPADDGVTRRRSPTGPRRWSAPATITGVRGPQALLRRVRDDPELREWPVAHEPPPDH
jgi:hypothetical protein